MIGGPSGLSHSLPLAQETKFRRSPDPRVRQCLLSLVRMSFKEQNNKGGGGGTFTAEIARAIYCFRKAE